MSAETLNRGQVHFRRHCAGCHGRKGDGKAPSATGMKPLPRDFTRGFFKYKSVVGDSLPTDEDLLFIPEITVANDTGDIINAGENVPPTVFPAIKKRLGNPLLLSPVEVVGKQLRKMFSWMEAKEAPE